MKRTFSIVVIFIAVLPFSAYAAIVVNEIAWMGTASSANDEWIELKNTDSEAVDVTGWSLAAADGTPEITLEGTIAPGGVFLLERTNDDTVPGVTASQIYTGALSNSGEALTLKNSDGVVADSVDASGGWQAGDNTTKETMQRSGSVWVTAHATPGADNVSPTPSPEPIPAPQSPPPSPAPAPMSQPPPVPQTQEPQVEAAGQVQSAPPQEAEHTQIAPAVIQDGEAGQKQAQATSQHTSIGTSSAQKATRSSAKIAVKQQQKIASKEAISTSSISANASAAVPGNDAEALYGWLFGSVGMGLAAGMGVLYVRRKFAGPTS